MNGLKSLESAVRAKHFREGIYYQKEIALNVEDIDTFSAGNLVKYALIDNEYKLGFIGNTIQLKMNDVVIESYSNVPWTIKGKFKLETGRILQVKEIMKKEEVISPYNRITRYTIILG